MSTWIQESNKSWWHRLCIKVLRSGPIPKHVAFIMDGNRRFAKRNRIDRGQGHLMGFEKLAQTLDWCLELGVTEVTVYAFSIENFKRSKEEVDGLMELARQKFARLMQEKELIEKHGVSFRVLGNLSLLPKDIQEIIAEAVTMTQHNNRAILNVCFAYTSRDEMTTAIKDIAEGVQLGLIEESDINEHIFEECLYTHQSKDPDLLVRTSGEVRLSDFLLWQSGFSVLSFMKVLWPDFSIWDLYLGILYYQQHYPKTKAAKLDHEAELERLQRDSDYRYAVQQSRELNHAGQNGVSSQDKSDLYSKERQKRIQTFLSHVHTKRQQLLSDIMRNRKKESFQSKSITCDRV